MRRTLAMLTLVVLALAGCSGPLGSDADPTSTPLAVQVDEDIASGCWNASQRTLPLADAAGGGSIPQWSQAPANVVDAAKTYTATVATSKGTFVIDLLPKVAPVAVNNFVCLARAGFYDGVIFHRVVPGFVIQGGDPTGTGGGGPGYEFAEEPPVSRDYTRGTVAMAKTRDPNTTGSQFFVCLADVALPKEYTLFGEVASGMETVDAIAAVPLGPNDQGDVSLPVEPITIQTVTIAEA